MIRTYDFYKSKFEFDKERVDYLNKIISDIEINNFNRDIIANNAVDIYKVCASEGKLDVFKKLLEPIPYDDNGVVRYRYMIDFFSLVDFGLLNIFPERIMDEYVRVNTSYDDFNCVFKETYSLDEVVANIVIASKHDKEDMMKLAYNVNLDMISTTRIKDTHARQISGLGHPIVNVKDVIRYSEDATLYANMFLFNNNIRTIANDTDGVFEDGKNYTNEVVINIDYSSLDEYNKVIADKYCVKNDRDVRIVVETNREETVMDVTEKLMKIISLFHKQDIMYGKASYNDLVNICNCWYINIDYSKYSLEDLAMYLNNTVGTKYYFDKKEDVLWENKNYYLKHLDYITTNLEQTKKTQI